VVTTLNLLGLACALVATFSLLVETYALRDFARRVR
jgi:hypothetical protein